MLRQPAVYGSFVNRLLFLFHLKKCAVHDADCLETAPLEEHGPLQMLQQTLSDLRGNNGLHSEPFHSDLEG